MPDPPHIFDLTPDELTSHVAGWGMPPYRATQVLEWVYRHGVAEPAGMTNLSKDDRDRLSRRLVFLRGSVVRRQVATDDTQKLLIDWSVAKNAREKGALPVHSTDSQTECVMIPTAGRKTACISSQVGCPVGCKFCASGLGGLDGNLSAGQIVQQVWQLARLPGVGRISNVVFMGMGEPLANFEQVVRAARTLTAKWGMGISARRITISTVGLPAQMRRLAEIDLPVTLAVSLHAPNDEIRRRIIPWAEFVTIEQIIDAGRHYFDRTGREVTLEYILLAGENDRPEHARQLAAVAKKLRSNVNLIRYNEVAGLPYARPADVAVHHFQAILHRAGVNTHLRASLGRDIAAACGQLRHEQPNQPQMHTDAHG